MASKIEIGSEVVWNRGTQRMHVRDFVEIDGRQYARCEWRDKEGVEQSQQFPVDELALAVDPGPVGGQWAASRRTTKSGED
jgi:hypothetical protein